MNITILNPGQDYQLAVVSVADPRGGSGFTRAQISSSYRTWKDRTGGGRIYKVEMSDLGTATESVKMQMHLLLTLYNLGDGADLNEDGFPDGKIDPDKVKI